MNLPKPMTNNNFDKLVGRLGCAAKEVAETTMQDACAELTHRVNTPEKMPPWQHPKPKWKF